MIKTLRSLFVICILQLLPFAVYPQKTDSLLQLLPSARDTTKVQILGELSLAYMNRDNAKALDYAKKALVLAKKTHVNKLIAAANIELGHMYTTLGDYSAAQKYVLEALTIHESEKNYAGAAKAANILGNMYLGQENYPKSKEYYLLVTKYAGLLKNDYVMSLGYMGVSNVLGKQGDLGAAIKYLEKSEKGFKRANRKMEYLATLINKAGLYIEMKKYRDAYQTLISCKDDVEASGDKYFISTVYISLGTALTKMGRYQEALDYLHRSITIVNELKSYDSLKSIYLNLSQLYEQKGNADSALVYLNKYVLAKDSLFKSENLKQMNEMEAKFQSDKKNAEIRAQNEKLKANKALLDLKNAKEKRDALLRNALFGILFLVAVFLFFMFRSNIQKKRAYQEVTAQKQIIEQKNKEILDSIEYARRIQRTLLASDSLLKKHLHEHFIFYKPKDIVSGDFYWATEVNNGNGSNFLMCTADCTGHGVPGAFMSLLCISFLNEITRDRRNISPNEVFTRLKHEIVLSLNPEEAIHTRDGMDAVLCNFDFTNLKLQMACANNPVIIIRGDEVIEIKPDKNPIGKNEQTGFDYTLHTFDLEKGDQVYTFTDGFSDQFGGESGKKFKFRQFREMLFTNRHLSMVEQKKKLESCIDKWKGNLEQLDDILVIGIRV